MRAAVLERHGDPSGFVVREVPDPVPGEGEALVRVRAVCVNRTDVHVLERTNIGRFVTLPYVGGLDPAGELAGFGPGGEAAAGARGLALGDAVVARPMIPCLLCRFCIGGAESACERPAYVGVHRPGGFAELVALPVRALFAVPAGLDAERVAVTAHSVPIVVHLLEGVAGVTAADRVLVLGAAGGLGLAAVQLARHLGATVVAVAGTEAKLEALRALGPDAVLSSAEPGLAERVRAATGGVGVTVAVDNVGDPGLWAEVVGSMDRGGRIVTCGAHAGGHVALDLNLFYRQQLRLLATAGTSTAEFERGLDLVATGAVRPLVAEVFPLAGIGDAFRALLARRNTGKLVVRPDR